VLDKDGWTGFVVDIRAVKGLKKAVNEIGKYCFKPSSLTLGDKAFLSKLFFNRRLYSFFGEWFDLVRGYDLDDFDNDLVCVCGGTSFQYIGDTSRSHLTREYGWHRYLGRFISLHPFDSS
jgi:hypothetical protein